MTSLFNCENARANIDALFNKYDIILLNSSTLHIPQELRIRSRGTERHSASN